MSEKLGTVRYVGQQYQFLESNEMGLNASPETQKEIDEEVKRIISEQYQRAQHLLLDHKEALEALTRKLLETETVDGEMVKQVLQGR